MLTSCLASCDPVDSVGQTGRKRVRCWWMGVHQHLGSFAPATPPDCVSGRTSVPAIDSQTHPDKVGEVVTPRNAFVWGISLVS